MIISNDVYAELKSIISTALSLDSEILVTKATKFIRHDWKSLIEYFEKNLSGGLTTPFILIRSGPTENIDIVMSGEYFRIPTEIFLVRKISDNISTTVTSGATSATQTVGSTEGMFAKQLLFFEGQNNPVRIVSITNATTVVLSSSITTTTGDLVRSDTTEDVEVQIELLRYAFRTGASYSNFLIENDPEQDLSDMNPANEYYGEDNLPLFAGSLYVQPLVGDNFVS